MQNNYQIVKLNIKKDFANMLSIFKEGFSNMPNTINSFIQDTYLQNYTSRKKRAIFGINNGTGKLIGFAKYVLVRSNATLDWLVILPIEQKKIQHYGSRLLNDSIKALQKTYGIKSIRTATIYETRNFYLKNGFNQYNDSEIIADDLIPLKKEL